ncbi:MAG: hypothetical protein ACRD1R_18770, partial [Acidobacteriota bacterium]
DFSQSFDVNNRLIAITDPLSGEPFPNNVIPPNRIDSNGQALLKAFPSLNFTDRSVSKGNYNYVFQDEQRNPQRTETLKLDYNVNSNNLLAFNYTHYIKEWEGTVGIPGGGGSNFDQLKQHSTNDGHVFIGRYQRIFSPTLISESTVSYSTRPWFTVPDDDDLRRNQRDQVGFNVEQFNPKNNPLNVLPNATFGGIPNAARFRLDGRFPLDTTHEIFTVASNVTKILGNHTFKIGVYTDRIWANNQQSDPYFGEFNFSRNVNNPLDTGYAYANAILGVFNSYTESTARPLPRAIVSNIEWFLQDNWKVARKLTLDLGVRFYWLPHSFVEGDGVAGFFEGQFDPSRQVQLIQPARVDGKRVGVHPGTGEAFPANFIGAVAPGSGDPSNGMISPTVNADISSSLMDDRGIHFGPRVGLAYDLSGRGRTVLRSGFGIFYQRMAQGQVLYPYTTQPPLVFTPTIFFGTLSTLKDSSGVLFPTDVLALDPAGKIPTVMNFSLGLQQDIGFGTVLDVSYVGSLGRHLLWQRNLNAIPFGARFDPANIDPTTGKPLPPAFLGHFVGYNDVMIREPASSSNYHSLQVTVNRRFARELQFGASWTWSKALDYNTGDTANISALVPVRIWNYGLSAYDRTHVLKVNWIWSVPSGTWSNPVLKGILDNWQVSGIASFVSGPPLSVNFSTTKSVDITGSPTHGARVVLTGSPILPKDQQTFDQFFRTDVFQLPDVGTVGNAARTVLRGPGTNNWDIALYKNFPLDEKRRIQVRWEMYNAFNHTQFSGVDTNARFNPDTGEQVSGGFGQVTSARDPRIMQFALRFYF